MKFVRFSFLFFLLFLLIPQLSAQSSQQVQCGSIIESEFAEDEEQLDFPITIAAGDRLTVQGEALGDTLSFVIAIFAPDESVVGLPGDDLFAWVGPESSPLVETGVLSARGEYTISVFNGEFYYDYFRSGGGGVGVFTLYISCTLRDGTGINAGDIPSEATNTEGSQTQVAFSGFGFPGVNPVDFSSGIEIPMSLGQAQNAPLANDIALYSFEAIAGQTATLTINRLSGDISIGITVIKRDNNEIIFIGGMPSSNNLSVELSFPADGSYIVGLFRLNTNEHNSSSGAVQIVLE